MQMVFFLTLVLFGVVVVACDWFFGAEKHHCSDIMDGEIQV